MLVNPHKDVLFKASTGEKANTNKTNEKKQQHKCRFKTEGRTLFSLTFGKNADATFISS